MFGLVVVVVWLKVAVVVMLVVCAREWEGVTSFVLLRVFRSEAVFPTDVECVTLPDDVSQPVPLSEWAVECDVSDVMVAAIEEVPIGVGLGVDV